MPFENSTEQYKPREVNQTSTAAALLPSNQEYQNFFKPSSPGSSEPAFLDFGNQNIYGDQSIKVAQDFPIMPTLVPSPDQLGITPIIEIVAEKTWNPYRYTLDETMSTIPEKSWKQAYEAFPQFKHAGLSEKQATEVMKALVRNELYNYDLADKEADDAVRDHKTPLLAQMRLKKENDITIGLTQISTKGVTDREREYPHQVNFKGHEEQALMDPANAPILVAATLAHNIEMYVRHHVPITEQSLAYSYNPSNKNRILPTDADLKGSIHVSNVMHQLAIIRHQIEAKPDES